MTTYYAALAKPPERSVVGGLPEVMQYTANHPNLIKTTIPGYDIRISDIIQNTSLLPGFTYLYIGDVTLGACVICGCRIPKSRAAWVDKDGQTINTMPEDNINYLPICVSCAWSKTKVTRAMRLLRKILKGLDQPDPTWFMDGIEYLQYLKDKETE